MYGNILQLLGELGVENGQQPVVHSLHVHLWIGRSIGRHRRLLCQHLACRQKGNKLGSTRAPLRWILVQTNKLNGISFVVSHCHDDTNRRASSRGR